MFELSQRYYRPYIHVFLIKIFIISMPKLNMIEPLNARKGILLYKDHLFQCLRADNFRSLRKVNELCFSSQYNLHYYTTKSHENDADEARRARAFCRIKTVPRRQYIAFSVSELDEWECMTKRLAILDKASFAVIPQPPYASTTRGTHISNLFQNSPKHCSLISLVHLLQLRYLRSDQHLK